MSESHLPDTSSQTPADVLQPRFSAQLLSQLGVTAWQQNSAFFDRPVKASAQKLSAEAEAKSEVESLKHSVAIEQVDTALTETYRQVENVKVFLANGIDEVLQNEQAISWRLWENIQQAFGWEECQIQFFEASTMVSEDSLMACMEEIMHLSADQVFVMLDEHPVIEMLQEGVEVVQVPSLDEMLEDPYAKQKFYQTMIKFQ